MSTLTLEMARVMVDRAIARAKELGVRVSIAVMNDSGHLVAFNKMDGASFVTIEIAQGKAWTSAAFKTSSATVEENMRSVGAFASGVATAMQGRFMPRQGAVSLPDGIGAVGVSGAASSQDEDIASYAMAGLGAVDSRV